MSEPDERREQIDWLLRRANAAIQRAERAEAEVQGLQDALRRRVELVEWSRQVFYRQGWNAEGDFLSDALAETEQR